MAGSGKLLWRSKLRRLRTLTQWRRSHSSLSDQEQLEASAAVEPAEAAPAKRRGDERPPTAAADVAPAKRRRLSVDGSEPQPAPPVVLTAEAGAAEAATHGESPLLLAARRRKLARASAVLTLALRAQRPRPDSSMRSPKPPPTPPPPPPKPASASGGAGAAPKPRLEAGTEIRRILAADEANPEEVLGLDSCGEPLTEDVIISTWKRLVLLLHPDKVQRLPEKEREDCAEALHRVHKAKDDMRQRSQAVCAEVPAAPEMSRVPKCLDSSQGKRKYEVSWKLPESQDPQRPVENYEIWGPMYFSETGEPFQWTLLATVPSLQPQFILVEEAPTQQDVMWACDRVLRPTLPICVHAVNGKGQSEPLTFELPWATTFPWLSGTPSVLCSQCFRMSACTGAWTKCNGCMSMVSSEQRVVVRCPDCQGEVLWAQRSNIMRCTCCHRVIAKDNGQQWRPGTKPLHGAPPSKMQYNSAPRLPPRPPSRPVQTQQQSRGSYSARRGAW